VGAFRWASSSVSKEALFPVSPVNLTACAWPHIKSKRLIAGAKLILAVYIGPFSPNGHAIVANGARSESGHQGQLSPYAEASGTIGTAMFEAPEIPGAQEVIAWFGYWPTLHDAEVLSISLHRRSGCRVAIHAFEVTREIDQSGHYAVAKHAVVTFCMEGFPRDEGGISNTRIEFFNDQNVLSSASVNTRPEGYELVLEGCHGVDGSIVCERMSVSLEAGVPPGSIYQRSEP
jgi:hypothetical protein